MSGEKEPRRCCKTHHHLEPVPLFVSRLALLCLVASSSLSLSHHFSIIRPLFLRSIQVNELISHHLCSAWQWCTNDDSHWHWHSDSQRCLLLPASQTGRSSRASADQHDSRCRGWRRDKESYTPLMHGIAVITYVGWSPAWHCSLWGWGYHPWL